MDTMRICEQCRQPLPENAPEGLCPACLAKAAPGTRKPRRVLGLRVWVWPLIAIALGAWAIYVPPPGPQPEPRDIATMFRPTPLLVTPDGGSYRVVAFEKFRQASPVYAMTLGTTQTTTARREIGFNPAHFGFFEVRTRWKYRLAASRFDHAAASGSPWLSDSEVAKVRPLVIAELNRRSANHRLGQRLNEVLASGVISRCPMMCWQNIIVLAAWCAILLSLFAFVSLLFTTREARS